VEQVVRRDDEDPLGAGARVAPAAVGLGTERRVNERAGADCCDDGVVLSLGAVIPAAAVREATPASQAGLVAFIEL